MKTNEELNALKEESKPLDKKLAGLSEDELEPVTGGAPEHLDFDPPTYVSCPNCEFRFKTNTSPVNCPSCGFRFYVIV